DQFLPWLVVDPATGKLAITYYDTVGDSTRLSAHVYYQSSTNGGQTWSSPLRVTSAATDETTSGARSDFQYGDYTGLDGIAGDFFPSWTDRRNGGNEEIWTARVRDATGTCSQPYGVDDDTVALWRLDEGSGATVAHDATGLHHDGTVQG